MADAAEFIFRLEEGPAAGAAAETPRPVGPPPFTQNPRTEARDRVHDSAGGTANVAGADQAAKVNRDRPGRARDIIGGAGQIGQAAGIPGAGLLARAARAAGPAAAGAGAVLGARALLGGIAQRAGELAAVSPDIARAQAAGEVARIRQDLETAQRIGPQLAEFQLGVDAIKRAGVRAKDTAIELALGPAGPFQFGKDLRRLINENRETNAAVNAIGQALDRAFGDRGGPHSIFGFWADPKNDFIPVQDVPAWRDFVIRSEFLGEAEDFNLNRAGMGIP